MYKRQAEKALWSHVQYVRELLDIGVLKLFVWIDTRDMYADGLTKGSVDRIALHMICDGRLTMNHAFKFWKPRMVVQNGEEFLRL